MSHTPGPWMLNGWDIVQKDCTDSFPALAAVLSADGSLCMEDINANARLIAAAPELLSELKRLISMWEEAIGYEKDYMDMADAARAAIAKAEGRAE